MIEGVVVVAVAISGVGGWGPEQTSQMATGVVVVTYGLF
jgi:hypothetical protein